MARYNKHYSHLYQSQHSKPNQTDWYQTSRPDNDITEKGLLVDILYCKIYIRASEFRQRLAVQQNDVNIDGVEISECVVLAPKR